MEIFTKKSIVLKIVIALVIVILFNFSAPTISNAGMLEAIGGTLLEPIVDLLISIGDAAMYLIQKLVMGLDNSLVKLSTELGDTLPKVLAVVLGVAAGAALTILTGGIGLVAIVGGGAAAYASYKISSDLLPKTFYLPIYVISPEEMFENKIALLDVNFFNPNKYDEIETASGETVEQPESTASQLQSTIARWYLALRNFAIVVLLSILLYTAIRIIVSSTAQDKAKYKEKLFSWIVAACLLFFMHYIMTFATTIVEAVSEGINKNSKPFLLDIEITDAYEIETTGTNEDGETVTGEVNAIEFLQENGYMVEGRVMWPSNLTGKIKLDMQLEPPELDSHNLTLRKLGYAILFLIMVFYTIAFLVVYIKRLIMLAFLTMIAPLVAMTYPIDKMNDGNAQAFNMWLKEYIFNLLLQPLHLILYTMLVGSAIDFAQENIIYAVVAIGFIFQAEKIMRKFFGFEKAGTLASGSAIGGALAMAGINQLGKISKLGSGKKGEDKDKVKNSKIYQRKADKGQKVSDLIDKKYGNNRDSEGEGIMDSGAALALESENSPEIRATRTPDGTDTYRRNQEMWRDEMREQGLSEDYINKVAPLSHVGTNNVDGTKDMGTPIRTAATPTVGTIPTIPSSELNNRNNRPRAEKKEISGFKKALKGSGAVLGAGAKYVAPKAARMALKAGLGATAGAIGVAGGLATADDSNIWKMGLAGAAGGWTAGKVLSNATPGIVDWVEDKADKVASTYTIGASGEEAEKERQKNISDKLARRDKTRRKLYAEELDLRNKQEIDMAMDNSQKFRESGVTDDDLIIKAMKAEGFGEDMASQERIILAGLAQETGDDVEKIKQLEGRLQEKGISAKDARKYTDGIRAIYSKT